MVLLLLGYFTMQERRDPQWSRRDFAECQLHLRYLGQAIDSYERDYHRLPANLDDLRPQYLERETVLRCPLEQAGRGVVYEYHPEAAGPDDDLVTCRNHGQGVLVLQRNGQIRLPRVIRR